MNEELRARYLEGDTLTDAERALLAGDREGLDGLLALIGDQELWDEPRASLEDDIVELIGAEAGAPQAPAGTGPGNGAVVSLATARRRTVRAAVLSAAAAAVLAAGLTAAVTRAGTGGPPNQVEVALPEGRPGGVEVADTRSGLRIRLDAPDLERLPDGQHYQGWLRALDGKRLVSVGTFHSGDGVTLWAGVALTDFPTLTVTIEPDDGDAASSGNRVLVVPLLPS